MTTTPLDLDSIRAEYDQLRPESGELADNIPKLLDELAKTRRELEQTKAQRNLAADWLESSAEVERERDAAREELAKTRAELERAHAESDMWMRQLEELTNAAGAYRKRTEHELERVTGVAKALRITVAEMLSGKQHTRARTLTWESTLKYATEALANPATTAEPAPKPMSHGYTAHGHRCCEYLAGHQPGMPTWPIAKCGGPGICAECTTTVQEWHSPQPEAEPADEPCDPTAATLSGSTPMLCADCGKRHKTQVRLQAEPADEPKATCHLPVQNGEPCGLLTCRKHGCRAAPTAEPTRTYLDMPVVNCGTDVSHMAHVYPVDGEKVVCRGLLPHSVPLDDAEPAAS